MNKKCTHCGETVEEYFVKSKKICKSCNIRMNNCNHRNQPYIKILDLPEAEREAILAKRHNRNKNENINNVSNNASNIIKPVSFGEQRDIVMQDILDTCKEKGISWPKDFSSILPVFQQMRVLLSGYIDIYLEVENILNRMELDYKHAKEYFYSMYNKYITAGMYNNEEFNDIIEKRQLWEERHNALLEIRRDVKNVVAEYNAAGVIFTDLQNDKSFMSKFNNAYDALIKLSGDRGMLSNGNYRAEVSRLVSKEDFCVGFKSDTSLDGKYRYQVVVETTYNGVRNRQSFTRVVWAEDEEDAKNKVVKFINDNRDKFKFNFKTKDVYVTKLTQTQESPQQ